MAEEVVLTVKVKEDGGLELLSKKSKKASSDMDKVSKSAATADRQLKGAAQASSNTTKNFSKMSQGITGGLVPAYATLAATLFAVGAAFRFFKDAADLRILQEGQLAYARNTGKALNTLTKDLQAATEGQLMYREAASAAAIGQAAGLTSSQINSIGAAAKNSSIALGRDLTDSFNRLVRGITKAEPELLDELGIILRLETATEKYASKIGKARTELNAFERSQAVFNEVIGQAEEKYGNLNVEVNQFNKLAVALSDALNSIKSGLEPIAGFIANVFTNNIFAAISAVGLFATSMIGSLLPSMDEVKEQVAMKIKETEALSKRAEAKVRAFNIKIAKENRIAREAFLNERKNLQLFFEIDDEDVRSAKGLKSDARDLLAGDKVRNTGAAYSNLRKQIRLTKAEIAAGGKRTTVFRQFTSEGLKDFEKTLDVMQGTYKGTLRTMSDQTKGFVLKQSLWFDRMKVAWSKTAATMSLAWGKFVRALNFVTMAAGIIGAITLVASFAKEIINLFDNASEEEKRFRAQTERLADTFSNVRQETAKIVDDMKELKSLSQSINFTANLFGNLNFTGARQVLDPARIQALQGNRAKAFSGAISATPGVFASTIENLIKNSTQGKALLNLKDTLKDIAVVLFNQGADSGYVTVLDTFVENVEKGNYAKAAEDLEMVQRVSEKFTQSANAIRAFNAAGDDLNRGLGSLASKTVPLGELITPLNSMLSALEGIDPKTTSKPLLEIADTFKAFFGVDINSISGGRSKIKAEINTLLNISKRISQEKTKQFRLEEQIKDTQVVSTRLMQDKATRLQIQVNESKRRELLQEREVQNIMLERATNLDPGRQAAIEAAISGLDDQLEVLDNQNFRLQDQLKLWNRIKNSAAESFESSMTTALTNFISATESSLKDLLTNFARDFLTSISKTLAQGLTDTFLGFAKNKFGGGSGILSTVVNALVPVGSANGNVLRGGFQAFANGGIVSKPTLGLIGEGKHNEAVVPLPDGRSIPISGSMGNTEVNVNINMESGQSSVNQNGGSEQLAQFGKRIGSLVKEEIAKEKRPGGLLWSGR